MGTQQNPPPFPQQVAASGNGVYAPPPAAARIDNLSNTTITNPTITGGSITAASITGTIGNAINSALATIDSLTTTQLVATNSTTTNATTTKLFATNLTAGATSLATTTVSGNLTVSGTITGGTLAVAGLASGGAVAAPYFTATSTSATSTFAGAVTTSSLTLGALNGFLKATAGAVSTSLISLTSDITGILGVANGGTGWAAIQSGALMYGNGTNALATTTAGTSGQVLALVNGIPSWTATTTFSNGLAYANGNVTNTGVLALGPLNQTTSGTAIFATSTIGTDFTITGSGSTITFNIPTASATNRGLLSSADWSAFAGKISSSSLSATFPIAYNSGTGAFTWSGLSTSSAAVTGNIPYFSGPNTFANVATTSPAAGSGISLSGTSALVGGSGLTITNTGVLSLAQNGGGTAQNGAITFATSSATSFNGLILSHTITNAGGTFTFGTPNITGTLNNSGLTNSTISGVSLGSNLNSLSHNASLSGTSYNGSAAVSDWGLNLGNANSWTTLQTFTNASSTLFSAYGPAYFGATATSSFNSAGQLALVSNGLTVGASQLVVSGGNVGIGTTSPDNLLALQTAGGAYTGLTLSNTGTGGREYWITSTNNSAGAGGGLLGFWDVAANSYRMVINGSGNVGIGTTTPASLLEVANLGRFSESATSFPTSGAGLELYGTSGSGTGAGGHVQAYNRSTASWRNLFLDGSNIILGNFSSGNVGIGTTTPNYKLDVWGLLRSHPATNQNLAVVADGNGSDAGAVGLAAFNDVNSALVPLAFSASRFDFTNGNVGIGTTSPDQALQVAGIVDVSAGGAPPGTNVGGVGIGYNYGSYSWIQSYNVKPLVLNPLGNNVGIATTAPTAVLDVAASSYATGLKVTATAGTNAGAALMLDSTGATTPGRKFALISTANGSGAGAGKFGLFDETGNAYRMVIDPAGNVGIGKTSPSAMLDVGSGSLQTGTYINTVGYVMSNGTMGRAGVGGAASNPYNINWTGAAAQLWIDSSNIGNIAISSDRRIKQNIAPLATSSGLAVIDALNPVTFNWKDAAAGTTMQYGFIAQDVQEVLPDLVSNTGLKSTSTPDGLLHLDYNGLFAPIVKAIQELATVTGTFKTNLITWLGSAGNGIATIAAQAGHFTTEVTTPKLCMTTSAGTSVCVTGDQMAALLSQAASSAPPGSVTSSAASSPTTQGTNSASSTPANQTPAAIATLTLNGNDPQTWTFNTPWQDNLGATFVHPSPLGQMTETIYSTSTVDTTVAGTTTIDYWATWYSDPSATTSAQTLHTRRSVIIPANDNTASSALLAANDNPPATNTNTTASTTTTASSTSSR